MLLESLNIPLTVLIKIGTLQHTISKFDNSTIYRSHITSLQIFLLFPIFVYKPMGATPTSATPTGPTLDPLNILVNKFNIATHVALILFFFIQ